MGRTTTITQIAAATQAAAVPEPRPAAAFYATALRHVMPENSRDFSGPGRFRRVDYPHHDRKIS